MNSINRKDVVRGIGEQIFGYGCVALATPMVNVRLFNGRKW
jgi:hypothetical protein